MKKRKRVNYVEFSKGYIFAESEREREREKERFYTFFYKNTARLNLCLFLVGRPRMADI